MGDNVFSLSERQSVIVDYLVKFPIRNCTPVVFGIPGESGSNVNGGTAVLITLPGGKQIVTTAYHIVAEFKKQRLVESRLQFQIGETLFNPDDLMIDSDIDKDLWIFDATKITFDRKMDDPGMPALDFYEMLPGAFEDESLAQQTIVDFEPQADNVVVFGGFPGKYRKAEGLDLVHESFSVAAVLITRVTYEELIINLDRAEWTVNGNAHDPKVQERDLGGISGGPLFADAGESGGMRPILIGFVKEYNDVYDQIRFTRASHIKRNGTLFHSHVDRTSVDALNASLAASDAEPSGSDDAP